MNVLKPLMLFTLVYFSECITDHLQKYVDKKIAKQTYELETNTKGECHKLCLSVEVKKNKCASFTYKLKSNGKFECLIGSDTFRYVSKSLEDDVGATTYIFYDEYFFSKEEITPPITEDKAEAVCNEELGTVATIKSAYMLSNLERELLQRLDDDKVSISLFDWKWENGLETLNRNSDFGKRFRGSDSLVDCFYIYRGINYNHKKNRTAILLKGSSCDETRPILCKRWDNNL